MKKYFKEATYRLTTLLIGLILASSLYVSCVDENYYANNEPEWLGASIYDYLQTDGNYKIYVKLIDELGQTETFKKTGSVTLFVANDSAFNRFFQNNAWGVTSYEQLTLAQKKLLFNFGMIKNAYTSNNLPNYNDGSLQTGSAMRRSTAISIFDSVPHDFGDKLPSGAFWNKYKTYGIYLLKDNTSWPIVQFTQKMLNQALISDDDFSFLTGTPRAKDDIHIFGNKVIKSDITCKNGYIYVLENVLIPPVNMAQYIKNNPKTQIFSKLLDRFSAPYFDAASTLEYRQLQLQHPELPAIDSIFTKGYFSPFSINGINHSRYPNGQAINLELLLPFDPGWNSYIRNASNSSLQSDMAAMFVPSDEAMTEYFNNGVLKDYGTWENVPDKIIMSFLQRHMRSSLIGSVPSRFPKMMDSQNSYLPVKTSDIDPGNVYLGINGAVCITNKVYPPDEFSSVYAPVLFSSNTKVFDWFIKNYENGVFLYKFYLLSLVNTYSFFVPTDEAFGKYIDPIAYSKTVPGAIKFWYNNLTSVVNATLYKYDKATDALGDSVGIITDAAFIKNRLLDIIEAHIVVNGVESGNKYYLSKGNNVIKVTGSGNDMIVEGGGDLMMNTQVHVTSAYTQSNGHTYFIDKPIQTPFNSVYKVLGENPEFSEFFTLLNGFPVGSEIFKSLKGIDFNVKFLNTFNYTVYAPTNSAIQLAITSGKIIPWASQGSIVGIDNMTDATEKAAAISKLDRFLRYHFQDNSVFVEGKPITNQFYQSATIKLDDVPTSFGTYKNKYYKIRVSVNGDDMTLNTENGGTAHVITSNKLLYNIMIRDYIFNTKPSGLKEIDGTSLGTNFSTSRIETSSTAVIHQIDNVLSFQ